MGLHRNGRRGGFAAKTHFRKTARSKRKEIGIPLFELTPLERRIFLSSIPPVVYNFTSGVGGTTGWSGGAVQSNYYNSSQKFYSSQNGSSAIALALSNVPANAGATVSLSFTAADKWTGNGASGVNPAEFRVSANGMTSPTASLSSASSTLTVGQTYYYEITTGSGVNESTASAEANATPTSPMPSVALSWSGVSGATYNVYRSTTAGNEQLLASGITTGSYTDSGGTTSSQRPPKSSFDSTFANQWYPNAFTPTSYTQSYPSGYNPQNPAQNPAYYMDSSTADIDHDQQSVLHAPECVFNINDSQYGITFDLPSVSASATIQFIGPTAQWEYFGINSITITFASVQPPSCLCTCINGANGTVISPIPGPPSNGNGTPIEGGGGTGNSGSANTTGTGGSGGTNTVANDTPSLVQYGSSTLAVVDNAASMRWFNLSGSTWVESYGGTDSLVQDSTNQRYVLTNSDGSKTTFYDFNQGALAGKTQFGIDADGNQTGYVYDSPPAPLLSPVVMGSLAAATYYVKTTYVTSGGQTLASLETTLSVAANQVVQVTSPPAMSGATGYNVYVSTSSGSETKQNGSTVAIGSVWTESTSGLTSGASAPASGSGSLMAMTRPEGGSGAQEQFVYTYLPAGDPNAGKVSSIELERETSGSGPWVPVSNYLYTYYASGAAGGNVGDLEMVQSEDGGPGFNSPSVSSGGSLAASTTYYYMVTAVTAGGEGNPSSEVSATTTSSNKQISLSWTAVPDALTYKVYRSTTSGGEVLLTSGLTSASFTDNGSLTPGTATPPIAVIDTSVYRYYASASSTGYTDALKYVFGPQSYVRAMAAGVNPVTSTSDTSLQIYADDYYQYDSEHQVSQQVVQGEGCSSCSGGLGTFTYSYANSGGQAGYNAWSTETTTTDPDGTVKYDFYNAYGENMLSVTQDPVSGRLYGTFTEYDSSGLAILVASPSAVNLSPGVSTLEQYRDLLNNSGSYSTSPSYQYLYTSSGLITITDYPTSTTATSTSAGDVLGYVKDTQLKQGESGTAVKQEAMTYISRSDGAGDTIFPIATDITYGQTGSGDPRETDYYYTWYSGTVQMQSETMTAPVVGTSQNGSGSFTGTATSGSTTTLVDTSRTEPTNYFVGDLLKITGGTGSGQYARVEAYNASTHTLTVTGFATAPASGSTYSLIPDATTQYFDTYGRIIWTMDGGGFISYDAYDPGTGAVVKQITDVNTSSTSDFTGLPSGWITAPGGGLELITATQVDGFGRPLKITSPSGNVTYNVFNDTYATSATADQQGIRDEVRTYQGFGTGGIPGAIQVSREYRPLAGAPAGQQTLYDETLSTTDSIHTTGGVPDGSESFTIFNWKSLSRHLTNNAGQDIEDDQYYTLNGLTYSSASAQLGLASTIELPSDTTSAGTWNGVYGAYGYNVVGGSSTGSTSVTPTGNSTTTWASSTTDTRALQNTNPATGRVAAAWSSASGAGNSFSVTINLGASGPQRVAVYLVDFDSAGRSERVDLTDTVSGAFLDSRSVSSFSGGIYLEYNLAGHTKYTLTFTSTSSSSAVMSGIFTDVLPTTTFYPTINSFDSGGRLSRTVDSTGTINRSIFDGLGRVISQWVGTNDTPASGYWSPTNNTGTSNMTDVQDNYYDTQTAPDVPALSQPSGGSLAAATAYVQLTYILPGGESAPSIENSLAVSASHLLSVASPASAYGATGYNVYVSNGAGGETLQNSTPIAIGTAWTEPTSGLITTGATPPRNGPSGDSNLTMTVQHVGGGAPDRITQNFFDWRDREVETKSGVQASEDTTTHRPIIYYTIDNAGEITETDQYDGDTVSLAGLGSTSGVPNAPSSSLLRARSNSSYDDQGRAYLQQQYDINPSTGALVTSTPLSSNLFFDHRGNVIMSVSPGGLVQKMQYDGAGRVIKQSQSDGAVLNSPSTAGTWKEANDASGSNDVILSETLDTYDADGNVILTEKLDRFDNDYATGAFSVGDLIGPTGTGPNSRNSFATAYYDRADRLVDSVDVGTNGGSAYTRPSSVPSGSSAVLVTQYGYWGNWQTSVTDPRGYVTAYLFDLMGRTIQEKDAFNASVNSGNPSGAWNRITYYSWYSAQHVQMTAVQLGSGIAQDTEYVYGVGSGSGSTVFSNNLLARVEYPYPTAAAPGLTPSQWQAFAYDDTGEETQTTDRNGDVHGYNHDVLGRETADIVTTLGSGVDGSVRRLGFAFNTQGLPFQQTSYSNTSGTTVVNQVEEAYNGLGQLNTQYQDHSGLVSHSTSPKVQYTYNEMASGVNNSRETSMTYPNGRVLNYNYSSGIDTTISRLSNEADAAGSGAGTDEAYTYLGLGTVVQKTDGNGVDLSYIQQSGDTSYLNDSGDRYTGLDRFGRVIDQYWSPTSSPTSPTDRFQLAYDENGNVLYKNNLLSSANSELYHLNSTTSGDNQTGYDPLSRLTSFSRGTLSASGHNGSSGLGSLDTVGTVVHGQSWTLDDEGNWSSFTSDATTQTRTNNTDNQITSISGATTPTYNNNGDTTKDERGYTTSYDAWDRPIVNKNASGTTIATFAYDANGWRIADSTGGQDRYYNIQWQEIEDRNGSGTTTNQYVLSADGNIQHLVLRDDVGTGSSNFGTSSSGLHRRLYYQQDANGNMTALTDTSGAVQERFLYDPYGAQTVLTPAWGATTDSFANVIGFQAGRVETATGLLNFRHREYSASLGRWMEEDPAGYVDGTNLYQPFDDSPIDETDYAGLDPTSKPTTSPAPFPSIQGPQVFSNQVTIENHVGTVSVTAPATINGTTPWIAVEFKTNDQICDTLRWIQFANSSETKNDGQALNGYVAAGTRSGQINKYILLGQTFVDGTTLSDLYYENDAPSKTTLLLADRPLSPLSRNSSLRTSSFDDFLVSPDLKKVYYHVHWVAETKHLSDLPAPGTPNYTLTYSNENGAPTNTLGAFGGAKLLTGYQLDDFPPADPRRYVAQYVSNPFQ